MSPNFADLLLLVDSRLPAGGHAHSGGIAPAIEAGLIKDIDQLEIALRARLKHQGPMQAAAVRLAAKGLNSDEIDHALDIRMPSKAARAASRAQGRGLIRVADQVWPEIGFEVIDHHHPVAFGVIAKSFGASEVAPLAFLQQSLMSGASAGVRLMGFDPISVTFLVSQMRSIVEEVSQSITQIESIDEMPAGSLPGLESLTENYSKAQVRLFAS